MKSLKFLLATALAVNVSSPSVRAESSPFNSHLYRNAGLGALAAIGSYYIYQNCIPTSLKEKLKNKWNQWNQCKKKSEKIDYFSDSSSDSSSDSDCEDFFSNSSSGNSIKAKNLPKDLFIEQRNVNGKCTTKITDSNGTIIKQEGTHNEVVIDSNGIKLHSSGKAREKPCAT